MSRNRLNYTHGDTGTKPSALDFEQNGRPDSQSFDWWWYTVSQAIDAHADEFDRLDSDNDGVVDEADYASDSDKLDGNHWSDIQSYISNNSAEDVHDNTAHNPNFATVTELDGKADDPHGNEAHSEAYITASETYTDSQAQDTVGGILSTEFVYDDTNNLISLDSSAIDTYTDEEAQDAVGTILSNEFTYDDANDLIALDSSVADNYSDEDAQDAVGTIMSGTGATSITYDDSNNSITIYSSDSDTSNHDNLSGVSSSDHHTRYSDSEASSAAPVQSVNGQTGDVNLDTSSSFSGDHADLSGVGSSDHHTRYTDSEASSAAPVQDVNGQTGSVNIDSGVSTSGGFKNRSINTEYQNNTGGALHIAITGQYVELKVGPTSADTIIQHIDSGDYMDDLSATIPDGWYYELYEWDTTNNRGQYSSWLETEIS